MRKDGGREGERANCVEVQRFLLVGEYWLWWYKVSGRWYKAEQRPYFLHLAST